MDNQTTITQLEQIIKTVLKRDNISISPETTSNDVDGWDSLTHMIIIAEVENLFHIKLSFRELMKVRNVGELTSIIDKKIK